MKTTDAAYNVLKKYGHPIHIQDLLDETLAAVGLDREPKRLAKIYTDLNMDIRFFYRGSAQWGLKEWQPRTTGRGSSARDRNFSYEDDSDDIGEDE